MEVDENVSSSDPSLDGGSQERGIRLVNRVRLVTIDKADRDERCANTVRT
ncbi:MAG: hypothetical protein ACYDGY_07855 [Acidimicrobiales bacterium]